VYKIVIIDDNKSTVQSLEKSVNWTALGIEVMGTAYDGIHGRDLILKTHPDIIITDIRMPGLDGLSMIEQIHKDTSDSRIIIITGYDEFQYASRAIKLSVFDYILKPINNEELLGAVSRGIESIEKSRQISIHMEQMNDFSRRALLLSLMTSVSTDEDSIRPMLKNCGIDNLDCFYVMAIRTSDNFVPQPLLRRIDDGAILKSRNVISLLAGTDLLLFVIPERCTDWRKDAVKLSESLLGLAPDLTVAVSGVHKSAHSIRDAYKEVRQVLLERSLNDDSRNVCFYDKAGISKHARLSDVEQVCDQLAASPLSGQERLDEAYHTMLRITGGEIRPMRTMLVLYCTKVLNKTLMRTQWVDAMDASIYEISYIASPEDAYSCLKSFYSELNNCVRMSTGVSRLVQNVLQHITLHAMEGLRLENVALYFHVSPNHLSALISKETGRTYQQHVLSAKLNISKKMLDDTRMSVEEISYAVGYENYISFYNAFKRVEGISPTDYRFRSLRSRE